MRVRGGGSGTGEAWRIPDRNTLDSLGARRASPGLVSCPEDFRAGRGIVRSHGQRCPNIPASVVRRNVPDHWLAAIVGCRPELVGTVQTVFVRSQRDVLVVGLDEIFRHPHGDVFQPPGIRADHDTTSPSRSMSGLSAAVQSLVGRR